MNEDNEPGKLHVGLVHASPYLPIVAAALALGAIWMTWSGWSQLQDESRRGALMASRDTAATAVAATLKREVDTLVARLASAPVQQALGAGDLGAAAVQLRGSDAGRARRVDVLPASLASQYAGLPKTGFGLLAAAEAALAEGKPMVSIIRDGAGNVIAVTAPARAGDTLVGVAMLRMPLASVVTGVDGVTLGDDSYLALRQGAVTLHARGDTTLSEGAERLATPVRGTGLRIAAAVPAPVIGAFGLGYVPSLVVASLLALLAWLVWRLPGRISPLHVDDGTAPTLSQVMFDAPESDAGTSARVVKPVPGPVAVRIDRGIFRAYDIRGIVGESLDTNIASLIGHAIGSLMAEKDLEDIVIGRDGRLSGPDMIAGLTDGLRKAGRSVIDIGMAPTPVIYFGAFHLRTGCCVSVTGSHNPPDYNGFKIVIGGETLHGDAITDLYARIAEDRLHTAAVPGGLSERDIADAYVERITDDVQTDRRLKIVVDAGNGVAGEIGPRVLEAIGAEVIPLYCEIDGAFPNHHPDPSDEHNLRDLIDMVQRLDADLGIAFDGDGDRLGVVTRDGQNIYADRLLMLFAADVLERNPGAVILYDVKCTGRLPGHILRHGGSPLMWKTGHSLIKAKMRETEAELAGEMSGHFFFGERWYGFDDGIYAAARLLEILASGDQSPSDVLNALPNGVSTPEIKVDAPSGDPHAFVERFVASASFDGARLSTIDGLRVDWPDGWGLVRASNTTPVLVMRFDSDTAEGLTRIQAEFRAQLLAVDPALSLPF